LVNYYLFPVYLYYIIDSLIQFIIDHSNYYLIITLVDVNFVNCLLYNIPNLLTNFDFNTQISLINFQFQYCLSLKIFVIVEFLLGNDD